MSTKYNDEITPSHDIAYPLKPSEQPKNGVDVQYTPQTRMNYSLYGGTQIVSSEMKMALMKFTDPLTLCFKFLLDVNKDRGLFGGLDKILAANPDTDPYDIVNNNDFPSDSALKYLVRIGEPIRAKLLKVFILEFVDLIRNYDFLIEDIEGLSELILHDAHTTYLVGETNKLDVKFRETVNSHVYAVLSKLRYIIFDSERNLYILPQNLTHFDFSILVYNHAVYRPELYQNTGNMANDSILPTLEKLSDIEKYYRSRKNTSTSDAGEIPFVNVLINITGRFSVHNIGSQYLSTVSNITSDEMVHTNMTLNCYSVDIHNDTKGSLGNVDIAQLFSTAAKLRDLKIAEDYLNTQLASKGTSLFTSSKKSNQSWASNFIDGWADYATNTLNTLTSTAQGYLSDIKGWTYNMKDQLEKLTDPHLLSDMATNVTNNAIISGDNFFRNKYFDKINSIMNINFVDNILGTANGFLNSLFDKPSNITYSDRGDHESVNINTDVKLLDSSSYKIDKTTTNESRSLNNEKYIDKDVDPNPTLFGSINYIANTEYINIKNESNLKIEKNIVKNSSTAKIRIDESKYKGEIKSF